MGCPVPKITKCDAGAKWLLDPNKIYEMVSAVVDTVDKLVTVKMRVGWDEDHIFAIENERAIETAGAQAVFLHGRTRVQVYKGTANRDIIRDVKQAVNILVIGNGDVKTPQDAEGVLKETGVDGVMIGRAALGNPWMIYRTVQYLETGKLMDEPSVREKMDVCKLHLDRLIRIKNENIAVREMRKQASWYLKGVRGNAKFRKQINQCDTRQELVSVLEQLAEEFEAKASQVSEG
jgi:nifR3 family TIM-barrel protein